MTELEQAVRRLENLEQSVQALRSLLLKAAELLAEDDLEEDDDEEEPAQVLPLRPSA